MTTPEESPRPGSQEALDQMLGRDRRPYVVARITDKGTILLLDDQQHEFHLLPKDAVELAIQILKAHCLTYGFRIEVPVPSKTRDSEFVEGYVDVPSLGLVSFNAVTARLKTTLRSSDGSTIGLPTYEAIRARVLGDVRAVLGVE